MYPEHCSVVQSVKFFFPRPTSSQTVVFKKTGKKGRKEFTQLEIFRMREKAIPVDNVQLNDVALQLHWEEGYSKRLHGRIWS